MAKSRRRDDDYAPAPKSDAYVGLLVISLLGMITAAVFLYLDWSSYGDKPPPLKNYTSQVAPVPPPPKP